MILSTEHRLVNERRVVVLTAMREAVSLSSLLVPFSSGQRWWCLCCTPVLLLGPRVHVAPPMLSGLVDAAVVGLLLCLLVPLGFMVVLLLPLQCDFCWCWWVQSHANIAAQHCS